MSHRCVGLLFRTILLLLAHWVRSNPMVNFILGQKVGQKVTIEYPIGKGKL